MKNHLALITGDIATAICHYLSALGAKVVAVERVEEERALQWQ